MSDAASKLPIRRTLIGVAVFGVLFALASLYLKDARTTISVLIGAGVALLNLWALAKIVSAMMPEEEPVPAGDSGAAAASRDDGHEEKPSGGGGGGSWSILAVVKIFALFGGAFLLWKSGIALPLPTLLGYAALPLGIVSTSVMAPRT